MDEVYISVKNLKKYYGEVKAVDGLSFEIRSGSVFGILGPNGAGKTTTIETLVGLTKKDGGEITILGYDSESSREELKKQIGVQLQSPALFPELTVLETLELFAGFYSTPFKESVVLDMIGLDDRKDVRVKELSGGQKHRLAVGLALIGNGKIIFLDEPTTGLDPAARRQLWQAIIWLKKEGKTVFLTTHYMDEAERLCDELIIVDQGKTVDTGTPQGLIQKYFGEKTASLEDVFLKLTGRELEDEYEFERV